MAKCSLTFWCLRVGIVLSVAIFSGCDHQGEVEKLIKNKYPEMQDGGRMKFTEYKESHTTDWAVRNFRAHGKVKWKEPWFLVATNTFVAEGGLPEVKIAELYQPVNSGVVFSAVFYRGRTDSKPQVTLQLPSGAFFTASGLAKKYPNSCVALPGGRTVGVKIDTSLYKKNRNKAISNGDQYTKNVETVVKENASKSEDLLKVDFKQLNKLDLSIHRAECLELRQTIAKALENGEEIKHKLSYFKNFPLEKMGQEEATKCLSKVEDTELKLSNMVKSVDKRIENVESEQKRRKRSGEVEVNLPTSRSGTQTTPSPMSINEGPIINMPRKEDGTPIADQRTPVADPVKNGDAVKKIEMGGIKIKVLE